MLARYAGLGGRSLRRSSSHQPSLSQRRIWGHHPHPPKSDQLGSPSDPPGATANCRMPSTHLVLATLSGRNAIDGLRAHRPRLARVLIAAHFSGEPPCREEVEFPSRPPSMASQPASRAPSRRNTCRSLEPQKLGGRQWHSRLPSPRFRRKSARNRRFLDRALRLGSPGG